MIQLVILGATLLAAGVLTLVAERLHRRRREFELATRLHRAEAVRALSKDLDARVARMFEDRYQGRGGW